MRDAMPPPPTHASTPRGARACLPACCAAARTYHCPAAQAALHKHMHGHRAQHAQRRQGSSAGPARRHQHHQRHRHQLEQRHGSMGDFKRPLSALNTYAIIMQSFRRFSMQLRCVSSKKMILFIILIFYRHSVFNALRPVCCEMDTVWLK